VVVDDRLHGTSLRARLACWNAGVADALALLLVHTFKQEYSHASLTVARCRADLPSVPGMRFAWRLYRPCIDMLEQI
jgi:hypothetical protein